MMTLAFLLFCIGVVFSSPLIRDASNPKELEVRILEKLFTDMIGEKKVNVAVFGSRRTQLEKSIKSFSRKIRLVRTCLQAQVILVAGSIKDKLPKSCSGRVVFTTKKELLMTIRDSVGAFYWKKGRPNILLIKERLIEKGIELPAEYERFIEPLGRSFDLSGGYK